MDKKQYNNIIDWTQQNQPETQTEDSLTAVRAVCNNMGVALPQGDLAQVAETLATDDYMGWKACTQEEAQEAANDGIPAIGVNEDGIVLLAADDEEQPVVTTAAVMTLERTNTETADMMYYSYTSGTTFPYVDIPQTGNIGTAISYMGYHLITSKSSNQYKLKTHSQNNDRYSYSCPEYYAEIDGRIVIATKENIGNQLKVNIGDYVQVLLRTKAGNTMCYDCIIGDYKGDDADNIWGHYNGQGVVEVVYHNYDPPEGYNMKTTNIWDCEQVLRITKVGNYGNYK